MECPNYKTEMVRVWARYECPECGKTVFVGGYSDFEE